jgi:hypothetical protein
MQGRPDIGCAFAVLRNWYRRQSKFMTAFGRYRSGAQSLCDDPQFANHKRQADHDQPRAGDDRAGQNQGIAEAEFLDGDSEGGCHQTGYEHTDPAHQKRTHS